MGLDPKPDDEKLIRQLAEQTGESERDAVMAAVRERLERLRRKGLSDRLMAIGAECASRMTEEERKWNYDAFLYDEETGLPK